MRSTLEELEIPEKVRKALQELLENLEKAIGEDFKLYLFGSYARGDWLHTSDVDVVVVSPKFRQIPRHRRTPEVRKLASSEVPFEIFCFTPEEMETLLSTSTFWREAASYWVQLHPHRKREQPPPRHRKPASRDSEARGSQNQATEHAPAAAPE